VELTKTRKIEKVTAWSRLIISACRNVAKVSHETTELHFEEGTFSRRKRGLTSDSFSACFPHSGHIGHEQDAKNLRLRRLEGEDEARRGSVRVKLPCWVKKSSFCRGDPLS
jgi:hypothetical protein